MTGVETTQAKQAHRLTESLLLYTDGITEPRDAFGGSSVDNASPTP
ncbi:hypothetical protein [Streptomyces mangrovisoli]|nr:hypothetical protein [Streptomyces mangrovisoli]